MSYRVGLTGGIGSGKTTVASIFSELGVPVIDTDEVSRQLTHANGKAIPAIRTEFGDHYIDSSGALDRAAMRKLVFTDSNAKVRLERILHPLILAQTKLLADTFSSPYIIVVIPLLFEAANYTNWLNHTVAVDCPEEVQLARTVMREGMDTKLVKAIISQQLPRKKRIELSDDLINNEQTLAELKPKIEQLHHKFLSLAQRSN